MKKIIAASVAVVLLLGVCLYQLNRPEPNQNIQAAGTEEKANDIKVATIMADYVICKDISEVEQHSDCIVLAQFTGQREIKNWTEEDGTVVNKSSISTVAVKKVYKGDMKTGDLVTVYEPGYFEGNEYYNIEGYNLMNNNGKYVLFLRKFVEGDTYTIVGMYQGKYDLNITDKAKTSEIAASYESVKNSEFFGENAEQFNKLKEQVVKKYR